MADPIDQLAAYVRSHLGVRVTYAQEWRVNELVRLVIRHWPHRHLEDAEPAGRNCKAIDHAMLLMRSQVREQWEARHGIGPLWDLLLGGTVTAIGHVLLDLWWPSKPWRAALRGMARSLGE